MLKWHGYQNEQKDPKSATGQKWAILTDSYEETENSSRAMKTMKKNQRNCKTENYSASNEKFAGRGVHRAAARTLTAISDPPTRRPLPPAPHLPG